MWYTFIPGGIVLVIFLISIIPVRKYPKPKKPQYSHKLSLRERAGFLWHDLGEFFHSSSNASVDNDGCDDGPRTSSNGW